MAKDGFIAPARVLWFVLRECAENELVCVVLMEIRADSLSILYLLNKA